MIQIISKVLHWTDIGMQMERRIILFYGEAAKKTKDINSGKLLRFLEEEEKKHLEMFQFIKKGITDYAQENLGKKITSEGKPLTRIPVFNSTMYKELTCSLDMHNIFRFAIKAEEMSAEYYEKAAKGEKDMKLKSFLNRLVCEEIDHKRTIQSHQKIYGKSI